MNLSEKYKFERAHIVARQKFEEAKSTVLYNGKEVPKMLYFIGVDREYGPRPLIFINSYEVWKMDQHLTDSYSEAEMEVLEPIIRRLDLDDAMESVYESALEYSIAELEAVLSTYPFMLKDAEYDQYIQHLHIDGTGFETDPDYEDSEDY